MSPVRRRPSAAAAVALATAALAAACLPPAPAPVRTLSYPALRGEARALLVLLPGRGDRAEVYEERGFVTAAQLAEPTLAVTAVDAHLGYYLRGVVVERLWADVVKPAREAGRPVWIAGISMGGLGAIAFAREHAADLAGLFVLAPYLGPDRVVEAVAAAGGLARWSPPPDPDDYERLWAFLKRYAAREPGLPPLWLGYGTSDRFARAHALLAAALPADRVLSVPGEHDWAPWQALWRAFLAGGGDHVSGATPISDTDFVAVAFLVGRWTGTAPDGARSEEGWTDPAGGVMLGIHRDVSPDGKAFFEYLRIERTPAGLAYVASPRGGPATAFPLVESTARRAVFANPAHDFPSRIVYWRDAAGALHARIEGTLDGAPRTAEWIWRERADW